MNHDGGGKSSNCHYFSKGEAVGDVLVIGGGASGLVAAIAARRKGSSVLLLERNPKVGKKLLTTGNHQCNLTNMDIRKEHYHAN